MKSDGTAGQSLEALDLFDWSATGAPPSVKWDPALQAAARLVRSANVPMALMIGPRGLLFANNATVALLAEKAGMKINGRSVLHVLPESASFYEDVLRCVGR